MGTCCCSSEFQSPTSRPGDCGPPSCVFPSCTHSCSPCLDRESSPIIRLKLSDTLATPDQRPRPSGTRLRVSKRQDRLHLLLYLPDSLFFTSFSSVRLKNSRSSVFTHTPPPPQHYHHPHLWMFTAVRLCRRPRARSSSGCTFNAGALWLGWKNRRR